MGKDFGNLGVHCRHIITYGLSPFEQRAFAGFLTKSPGNLVRRFFDQVFFIAPGLITAGVVMYYSKKDNARRQRKAYLSTLKEWPPAISVQLSIILDT